MAHADLAYHLDRAPLTIELVLAAFLYLHVFLNDR